MAEQTMAVWPMTLRHHANSCEIKPCHAKLQKAAVVARKVSMRFLSESAISIYQPAEHSSPKSIFIHLIHIVCFFHILSYSFYRSERLEMQLVSFGFS